MIRHWLRGLNVTTQASRRGSRDRRGRRQWGLEGLEDRVLLSGNPTAYTVNLTTDNGSPTTGVGVGNAGDLRYVINLANEDTNPNPAGSLIQFDPVVFAQQEEIILNSPLFLQEGDGPEVIDGPSSDNAVIDGGEKYEDFYVNGGVNATLSNLVITNGSFSGDGGAINNDGTLTVVGCSISHNVSGQDGGGIKNTGTLTVTTSSITSNSATSSGGGIYNTGTLTVTDSLIGGNTAANDGGGIDNDSAQKFDLDISNSTIDGNTAEGNGGGIENATPLAAVNTTITRNQADAMGVGGGLDNAGGTVKLDNTIVALNTLSDTTASDIAGSLSSASAFNLIGSGGSGGLTNGNNGNQVGVANPGLGVRGDGNVVPLLTGSPAINGGSNALAVDPATGQSLTTDQRGAGNDRISNGTVNIGAYELQVPAKPVTVSPPTIAAEKVLFAGKGRHRRVVGYELDFSAALDPARATSLADYELTQTLRHGRKVIARPVAFGAAYDASARSVTLTLAGRTKFTKGGRLVVVAAPPGGIASAAGVALDGGNQGVPGNDGTFVIAPKGAAISR